MVDITKYILAYRSVKDKMYDNKKVQEELYEVLNNSYQALCLDVDKTIREYDNIDAEMLEVLSEVLKSNSSLCFITGMGRTKSKETLLQVYKHMVDKKLNIKNITCATSNGAVFLETDKNFLDTEVQIVENVTVDEYIKVKSEIRKWYISEVLKQKWVKGNEKELIERSLNSSGDMSLRFVFNEFELNNSEQMIIALKDILLRTDLAEELSVFKGKHKDKFIWEISLTNKLKAVEFFENRYRIADKNVLKLGDQGKIGGNDFDMLNSYAGFSVDEIEPSVKNVLPVIDESGNIIKGTKATKKIIRDLNFKGER